MARATPCAPPTSRPPTPHRATGPLRFPDEPCRHKLLDLLGDLALLGPLPLAHVIAYKASHRLHVRLAAAMLAQDGAGPHVDVAGGLRAAGHCHVPTPHPQNANNDA